MGLADIIFISATFYPFILPDFAGSGNPCGHQFGHFWTDSVGHIRTLKHVDILVMTGQDSLDVSRHHPPDVL